MGRCSACIRDDTMCGVNLGAIECWERDIGEGKKFARGPTSTNCKQCQERKKRCELPATAELRRGLGVKPAAKPTAPSIAGSEASMASRVSARKRREEFIRVEMLPMKRAKVAAAEEQFQAELLEVLRGICGELAWMAVAAERTAGMTEKMVTVLAAQSRVVGSLQDYFTTPYHGGDDKEEALDTGGGTPHSPLDFSKVVGPSGTVAEAPKVAEEDDRMEGGSGAGGRDEAKSDEEEDEEEDEEGNKEAET
jgi:hypothetical protein